MIAQLQYNEFGLGGPHTSNSTTITGLIAEIDTNRWRGILIASQFQDLFQKTSNKGGDIGLKHWLVKIDLLLLSASNSRVTCHEELIFLFRKLIVDQRTFVRHKTWVRHSFQISLGNFVTRPGLDIIVSFTSHFHPCSFHSTMDFIYRWHFVDEI